MGKKTPEKRLVETSISFLAQRFGRHGFSIIPHDCSVFVVFRFPHMAEELPRKFRECRTRRPKADPPPTNTSRRETFAGNPKSGSKKSVVPNAPNALISVFPVPEITWLSVKNSPAQSGGRKRASPFGVRRALTRTVSPVWRVWSGEHPSNERRARTDVVCQATRTKGGPSSSRSVILGTR